MSRRLSQATVDKWLRENRPDFKPADYWFYTSNKTPIPGTCLLCNAKCAPTLGNMKNKNTGHCFTCTRVIGLEVAATVARKRSEQSIRRVAAERGYEVINVFMKKVSPGKSATHATLRCSCGNVWDVLQGNLCSGGQGCASCAEHGFNPAKPGAIYLIARNLDGVEQRGYGISNDWKTRTVGYKRFGWELLDVLEFNDGATARDTENMLNRVVGVTAGRSVEPDSVYYKNKEAWAEGNGIPMFDSVWAFLCWAAPIDARETQDA